MLFDNIKRIYVLRSFEYKPATKFNAIILLHVNVFALKFQEKIFHTSFAVVIYLFSRASGKNAELISKGDLFLIYIMEI